LGIALCFVPLILALCIFTFGFKLKITHQLIAVLLGLLAVLPISFIQYLLPEIPEIGFNPILHTLLKSLLLYGLIEELFKAIILLLLPNKNYDVRNFLLLAFVMGLALGCFESVVYYFDHLQLAHSRGATLLYGQIALRIFTSDIIHMMCTGLGGLFIYSCRNKPSRVSFLIVAVLLHGIYDFFAGFSTSSNLRWFSISVVFMAIIECRVKYTSLTATDADVTNREKAQ
jgi:RsiW-degrading membrane proteinase PrsW (M82 family)